MKQFLWRLAAFALAAAVLFAGVLGLSAVKPFSGILAKLTASTGYDASVAEEMGAHIDSVRTPDGADALILGDSVCNQILDPFRLCNDQYRIEASNRAVTLAGQYLLAKAFLDAHPDAADVYLIVTPDSFVACLGSGIAYQYAVAPFARAGLLDGLDSETLAELRADYGAPFLTGTFARWADASPLVKKLYLNGVDADDPLQNEGVLSDVARRNLENLAQLCRDRGAALHLLAAPEADTPDRRNAVAQLEQAMREAGLYEEFSSYFTSVTWYDPVLFQEDGTHFDYSVADMEFFAEVVTNLARISGLLDGIVLSYE